MQGQSVCERCGKVAEVGSGLVIRYGAGGRIHKTCVGVGEEVGLANGDTYRRPASLNSDAGTGTLGGKPKRGAA